MGVAAGEDHAGRPLGDGGAVHLGLMQEPAGELLVVSLPCTRATLSLRCALASPRAAPGARNPRIFMGWSPRVVPTERRWLDHGRWGLRHQLGNREAEATSGDTYTFHPSEGPPMHQIAVGPVHAGIIEPGHFRFTGQWRGGLRG